MTEWQAPDEVTLTLAGQRHGGWTSATVSRAVDQVAGSFSLELTEIWPGVTAPRPIAPGQACVVAFGGEAVITGFVDDVDVSYDGGSHSVSVRGRSATADLVDCSALHEPGEWHQVPLDFIARTLAKPFGIKVRTETGVGERFRRFRIQEGETAFEALERACRARGVLPTTNGRGELVLARAGSGGAAAAVQGGTNGSILAAQGTYSHRDRYSRYLFKAQGEGGDATHVKAEATDLGMDRYRPLLVLAEDQSDGVALRTRADWERNVRFGRSRVATLTVQGWRDAGGTLWEPNTLLKVEDAWLKLTGTFLVQAVTWRRDASGTLADLTVVPPLAFSPEPQKPDSEEGAGW